MTQKKVKRDQLLHIVSSISLLLDLHFSNNIKRSCRLFSYSWLCCCDNSFAAAICVSTMKNLNISRPITVRFGRTIQYLAHSQIDSKSRLSWSRW